MELRLLAAEAVQGGTAAIDTSVEVVCPTCLGGAHPSRLWCVRCEHAGRVRENLTICIPIPPAVADGAAFSVATEGEGRARRSRAESALASWSSVVRLVGLLDSGAS